MTPLRAAGGRSGLLAAAALVAGSLDTRHHEVQAVGSEETASQLVAVTAAPDTVADRFSVGPGPVSLLLGGAGLLLVVALVVRERLRAPVRTATV